jgi:hypothetical protein
MAAAVMPVIAQAINAGDTARARKGLRGLLRILEARRP